MFSTYHRAENNLEQSITIGMDDWRVRHESHGYYDGWLNRQNWINTIMGIKETQT